MKALLSLSVAVFGFSLLSGCSDPSGSSGYSDVGGGLTNYSVVCRKHDGLDSYHQKGDKVYITCKNGKKLTYTNN